MKLSRGGCLGISLVIVLIAMMIGLIGMAALLSYSRSYYTQEQEQVLLDNQGRRVEQGAPLFNRYYGYDLRSDSEKSSIPGPLPTAVAAQAAAVSARESHVKADMDVRYREREGVTVTAYDLKFTATYVVANPDAKQAAVLEMKFPFPQNASVLSEVGFKVDGSEPPAVTYSMNQIEWKAVFDPGQERTIQVSYRAEGVGSFAYALPSAQRLRELDLQVTVRGADAVNIPEAALQPTARKDEGGQVALSWHYQDVITNRRVEVELPARPSLAFAQRVERLGNFFMLLALAAPVLTCLFLAAVWIVSRLESLWIAIEHAVLMGIGFFLFYPLFILASGFVSLPLAFAIALVVGGGLVIGYGLQVLGKRLAIIYLIPLLVVFYGLLTRGLTSQRFLDFGLMVVISSIAVVALFMWRISQVRQVAATPAPVVESVTPPPVQEAMPPGQQVKPAAPPPSRSAERFCAQCGQRIEVSFKFCPACGREAQITRKCAGCGLEYIPVEGGPAFCPACGKALNIQH